MHRNQMSFQDADETHDTIDNGKTTINNYATRKTISIGNLEVALLATNAVQLKTLLGHKDTKDTLWLVSLVLVIVSLALQLINACVLVILGSNDLSKRRRQHCLVILNNLSLILSIVVNIVNVILNVIVAVDPDVFAQTQNETKSI